MTEPRVKVETWDKQPVPQERWGKDHWTTLLYLETVAVDRRGKVEHAKMRTSRRNWRLAGIVHGQANIFEKDKYPTRLRPVRVERAAYDRVDLIGGHDDWECLQDLADAGLLKWTVDTNHSTPFPVTVELTDAGREAASEARKRKEQTGRAAPE